MLTIRDARRLKNLTMKQVAEKLGVAPPMIGYYESGHCKISLEKARKLAEIYETPFDQLIFPCDQTSI